jgi:hypothetical protein
MDFVMQSPAMNPNLAEENLQTIRTLMERSALYRRALAPIMLLAGIMGLLAAAVGIACHIESPKSFATLWLGTAVLVVASTFMLARRQAFKDHEPLWSPPTYRVGQALLPPLFCGLFVGVLLYLNGDISLNIVAVLLWLLFYGCALHSAGFFMTRGIKWLGWIFISGAALFVLLAYAMQWRDGPLSPHWIMGVFFGGLQLVYGVYLYFTEKKNPAA